MVINKNTFWLGPDPDEDDVTQVPDTPDSPPRA